jgi:hypothetical protein
MTRNDKRDGAGTLFAARDVKAGTVSRQCMLRHPAAEFIRFLRLIDKQTPAELDLHLIFAIFGAEGDAARHTSITHKTEAVRRWLARQPRFYAHFRPISASSINAVEVLVATLTKRGLKGSVFRFIRELNEAIRDALDARTADPKSFRCTAPPRTMRGTTLVCHTPCTTRANLIEPRATLHPAPPGCSPAAIANPASSDMSYSVDLTPNARPPDAPPRRRSSPAARCLHLAAQRHHSGPIRP